MSRQFKCEKTFLFQAIQLSQTVLIQRIQFVISTDFFLHIIKYQKQFYIKQFSLVLVQFQCQKQFHFKQVSLV